MERIVKGFLSRASANPFQRCIIGSDDIREARTKMVQTAVRTKHILVDPTTEPVVPGFIPAPRLDSLENKRLGLIDDAKDGAQVLLEEIADVLKERYGVASVNYHRKPSASKPVDPDALQEMTKDCDYIVVAIGS